MDKRTAQEKSNDNAVRFERAVLGCLLEDPSLWADAELTTQDFLLSDHQRIWQVICRLRGDGLPVDLVTIAAETHEKVDPDYLASLLGSGPVPQNFKTYVRAVRQGARERQFGRLYERLGAADFTDRPALLRELLLLDEAADSRTIRTFESIPDIVTMDIPPVEYIVPALGIARQTVTLWTGADGDGKTFLAQSMAIAVARGSEFLGMRCQQCAVLYVDLENPSFTVQSRLRAMLGEEPVPELRVWGLWNEEQPPQAGSELLLTILKETKPLLIVDPFLYFHDADENEASAMKGVMQYLRACAASGSAVVILHHPAKTGSSRGSSSIRGGCDLALMHSLDEETGLITLKEEKNKNQSGRSIVVSADFEDGKFELSDAPWITYRNDSLEKLRRLISETPGISTKRLCAQAGGKKTRILQLLAEGRGTLWTTRKGERGAKLFYPAPGTCSLFPLKGGEQGNTSSVPSSVPKKQGTAGNTWEQGNRSKTERLCSVHGLHGEWSKPNGVQICLKCRQESESLKEVESGKEVPVLQPQKPH